MENGLNNSADKKLSSGSADTLGATVTEEGVNFALFVGVILFMAAIGFIQEARAEKAMDALKQMAAPKAKVKRDDKPELIAAQNIVPGDIIFLEAGDQIAADARILEASSLKVNESILFEFCGLTLSRGR